MARASHAEARWLEWLEWMDLTITVTSFAARFEGNGSQLGEECIIPVYYGQMIREVSFFAVGIIV
jgi:hypothetical protein